MQRGCPDDAIPPVIHNLSFYFNWTRGYPPHSFERAMKRIKDHCPNALRIDEDREMPREAFNQMAQLVLEGARRVKRSKETELSVDEIASLLMFSSDFAVAPQFYSVVNYHLRTRKALTSFTPYIWLTLHALYKCPVYQAELVYRGINVEGAELAKLLSTYRIGEQLRWHCFSSTSARMLIQENFLGEAVLPIGRGGEIRLKKGVMFIIRLRHGARSISEYSSFPHEEEILLPPNFFFKVVDGCSPHDGFHMFHLEELDPDDALFPINSEAAEIVAETVRHDEIEKMRREEDRCRLEEAERMRQEEERRRIEEAERMRQDEERRRIEEAERMRQDEERSRIEEAEKRQDEERRRIEEDERMRQDEERRRIEEAERMRQDEERSRIEEDEKMRQDEERRRIEEAERMRQEEERCRLEEAERMRQDEERRRIEEAERMRQEEERCRLEEDEKMRQEEEDEKFLQEEAERVRKEVEWIQQEEEKKRLKQPKEGNGISPNATPSEYKEYTECGGVYLNPRMHPGIVTPSSSSIYMASTSLDARRNHGFANILGMLGEFKRETVVHPVQVEAEIARENSKSRRLRQWNSRRGKYRILHREVSERELQSAEKICREESEMLREGKKPCHQNGEKLPPIEMTLREENKRRTYFPRETKNFRQTGEVAIVSDESTSRQEAGKFLHVENESLCKKDVEKIRTVDGKLCAYLSIIKREDLARVTATVQAEQDNELMIGV